MTEQPNVVLIHGAFADGSCWSAVIKDLQSRGYEVTAPQFPLTSLADDVARLRQALAWQGGPTIVVGHSYGGQVMTALGADTANVVGLVYVAAFGLDEGESVAALGATHRPRRRWRISSSTSKASAGCQRTTSSATLRPTSIRTMRRSCTRPNSRSR